MTSTSAANDTGPTLTRFVDTLAALNAEMAWYEGVDAYWAAALAAAQTDLTPDDLARSLREGEQRLDDALGLFSGVGGSIRPIIAGLLMSGDSQLAAFPDEWSRIRKRLRGVVLFNSGMHEAITVAVLMNQRGDDTIRDDQVERVRTILADMKKRHWWITGPEDLPLAAALSARNEPAGAIAARLEEVFQALMARDFAKSERTQAAAGVLAMSNRPAPDLAEAFATTLSEARSYDIRLSQDEYEPAALVALTALPGDMIWPKVVLYRQTLEETKGGPEGAVAFNMGAALAFMDVVAQGRLDENAAGLVGSLSVQSALAAQAAQNAAITAVIAASTASTAAACSASNAGGNAC